MTQAISSRKPTAPSSASSVRRMSSTSRSASSSARTPTALLVFGYSRSSAAAIAFSSLPAVSRLTPGLQTPERVESAVVPAVDQVGGARDRTHRREQIVRAHVLEIARHHPDDRVLDAVQPERPPDDRGIGAELRAPVGVADDHGGDGGGPVVLVREAATEHR